MAGGPLAPTFANPSGSDDAQPSSNVPGEGTLNWAAVMFPMVGSLQDSVGDLKDSLTDLKKDLNIPVERLGTPTDLTEERLAEIFTRCTETKIARLNTASEPKDKKLAHLESSIEGLLTSVADLKSFRERMEDKIVFLEASTERLAISAARMEANMGLLKKASGERIKTEKDPVNSSSERAEESIAYLKISAEIAEARVSNISYDFASHAL
jgi:chromosome segregation ATPase